MHIFNTPPKPGELERKIALQFLATRTSFAKKLEELKQSGVSSQSTTDGYSKAYIDSQFSLYVPLTQIQNYYTKSEIDNKLSQYLLTSQLPSSYTKSQIDSMNGQTAADIEELQQSISGYNSALQEQIDTTSGELQRLVNGLDNKISEDIQTALDDGTGVSILTKITENSTTLEALISRVNSFSDQNGIAYNAVLQQAVDTCISNNSAIASLENRYAITHGDDIEWMVSGFSSSVDPETSFFDLYTAAESSTQDAISALDTRIETVENSYVASANLTSLVQGAIASGLQLDSIAGVATKAYVGNEISEATTSLISRVTALENIGTTTSTSSLSTWASNIEARLSALATFNSSNGITSYSSGLITRADVDSAVSSLSASSITENGNHLIAAIEATVNGNNSNITLSADQIYLDATNTLANTITATQGSIGGWTIGNNNLRCSVESDTRDQDGDARYTETTNTIKLDTSVPKIEISYQFRNVENEDDLSVVRSSGEKILTLDGDGFRTESNSDVLQTTNEINIDGSGSLGNGGISWNASGDFTITEPFVSAVYAALGQGYTKTLQSGVEKTIELDEGILQYTSTGISYTGTDSVDYTDGWSTMQINNGYIISKLMKPQIGGNSAVCGSKMMTNWFECFNGQDDATLGPNNLVVEGGGSVKDSNNNVLFNKHFVTVNDGNISTSGSVKTTDIYIVSVEYESRYGQYDTRVQKTYQLDIAAMVSAGLLTLVEQKENNTIVYPAQS